MAEPTSIPPVKKEKVEVPEFAGLAVKLALGALSTSTRRWVLTGGSIVAIYMGSRWVDHSGEAWAMSATEEARKATDAKVEALSVRVGNHDTRFDAIDQGQRRTQLSLARIEGALGIKIPKENEP